MKIDFEHLGGIEKGSIELNDFTVFCGKNNSGKTYVMYALYGLLDNRFKISFDFVKPIVETLRREGSYCIDIAELIAQHKLEMVQHIQERFKEYLPTLFGVTDKEFINTKIVLHFSGERQNKGSENEEQFLQTMDGVGGFWKLLLESKNGKIQITFNHNPVAVYDSFLHEIHNNSLQVSISEKLTDMFFFDRPYFYNSFLLPAERSGTNLFFKELFSIRNLLLQHAQNDNVNPMNLLKDVLGSRYAEPVKNYIQFLNNIGSKQLEVSVYSEYAEFIEKNVLNGKYEVDEFGNVFFLPIDNKDKLPLHFSSSTVKTLFGLVFYLKHIAKPSNYLMIDEPELNLHPDNQREVARILAQLVNAGLKVVVSTHSNYFMREINNLIMLKNEFVGVKELREKYGYHENELLDNRRVSAYLFDKKSIFPMPIAEEGIIVETFDTVTDALNQSSDDIYFTMQDAKETDD